MKDFKYFYRRAEKLVQNTHGIGLDTHDLAVYMEDAYNEGHEDGVSLQYRDSGDL